MLIRKLNLRQTTTKKTRHCEKSMNRNEACNTFGRVIIWLDNQILDDSQ